MIFTCCFYLTPSLTSLLNGMCTVAALIHIGLSLFSSSRSVSFLFLKVQQCSPMTWELADVMQARARNVLFGGACVPLPQLEKECVPAGLLSQDEDETYGAELLRPTHKL